MNMFIYDENGNLVIRKPNGLEYSFENTDKPNLGFDFDVVVYDDIEVKIVEWEDGKDFDDQQKINLNDSERDAIEQYIENSAPPEGISLNQQYSNNLIQVAEDYVSNQCDAYGFVNLIDVVAAAREGSNHPLRSDARRVLEYYDQVWNIYVNLMHEIQNTREDVLKPFDDYKYAFPIPRQALIG